MNEIARNFLDETIGAFRSYKTLAEKASAQVSDADFFRHIDSEANSIAVIYKHLGGNMRSRWSEFLTTDGEKSDRRRDSEFVSDETETRESLIKVWENGWRILFGTLESLTINDLGKTVKIRGEDFTVVKALNRTLAHAAYHIGQITLLAKHFRGKNWETLSIPKNKSAEFNDYLKEKDSKSGYLESAQEFAKEAEKPK